MSDLITYYADEDLHPQFQRAFKWFQGEVMHERMSNCENCSTAILAGGALRSFFTNTPVRDYDWYGTQKQIECMVMMHSGGFNWVQTSKTDRSCTFRSKVVDIKKGRVDCDPPYNIVKRPFETPQDVLETFDFTVCMCAITSSQITFHPDFFTDLATKTLRFNRLEEPVLALWRLQKYIKLGYEIDRHEMWRLTEAIHDLQTLPNVITQEKERVTNDHTQITLEELFRQS